MEPTHELQTVTLPEGLRRQFAVFERRLWSAETTVATSRIIAVLAGSFILLFLSDRLWDTPAWLRLMLTAAGIVMAVSFGLHWARHWVWQRRDLRALSLLVQRRHRRLGDRLLGIVELSDETKRPEGMSPALCRAAIQQVSDEAEHFDFLAAVDRRTMRSSLLAGIALVAVILAPTLLAPAAVWNAAQRWLAPVANIERYTFVDLSHLPAHLVTPHGEAFELAGQVQYRSFWKPHGIKAWFERESVQAGDVEGGQLRLKLDGRTEKSALIVRVGDARRRIEVEPMHRPFLKELKASIQLPPYLQQPLAEESVQQGALSTLSGSKVILRGQANRPLQTIALQLDGSGPEPLVKVTGNTFEIGPLTIGRDARWQLIWRDEYGLANGNPWPLSVQARADQPPQVQIEDLSLETAILETDVLPIKAFAQDDYGVQKVGIAWEVVGAAPEATASANPRERQRPAPDAQQKRLRETFLFSPSVMQIPPDCTVDLRAFTVDYFPGRPVSESAHYRIQVVGLVQHAEWMRQQFEALFAQLEEVTRRQEAIANSTADLKQQPAEKLEAAEAGKQAEKQAGEQQQNARALEQLANEGSKALREAFRNPTFNEQTLREWAQNLKAMQDVAKSGMQKAAGELQSAQKEQSGEKRQEQLAQALMTEQEALRDLENLQKKMNQGLDNLQAQTLAQRLRQLSNEQKKIQDQLKGMITETIGLLPDQLGPRFQKANAQLAESQGDNQKTATTLQSEINRFFERTARDKYGQVSQEMKETNASDELERVRGLVQANIGMEAMQNLTVWTKRFETWADKLEPKKEPSSSGSGSGSGGPQDDSLMKQLVAFLRLRQQEGNLYERTRLLDQNRPAGDAYSETAKELSKTQFQMRNEISRIQSENQVPLLDEPLDHTFKSMREVEASLARPETGEPTAQAQAKTVENLTDLINLLNEQAKKNSSSSSQQQQQSGNPTAEEMAFLLQMMSQGNQVGMKPGTQPGGNRAGGDTSGLPPTAPGNNSGPAGESRSASKASGQTRSLPTEFREALENYFKAVEQKE